MTQRKNNTPYTAREKEKALKLLQRTKDMVFVAHRYHCTVRTLYRWKRSYDGTLESLENKSSRPHSVHPRAHTPEEVNLILRLVRRNPGIGLNELYGKLLDKAMPGILSASTVSCAAWVLSEQVRKRTVSAEKVRHAAGNRGQMADGCQVCPDRVQCQQRPVRQTVLPIHRD